MITTIRQKILNYIDKIKQIKLFRSTDNNNYLQVRENLKESA